MLEKIANYFDRFSMLPLHPPRAVCVFLQIFHPVVEIFSCLEDPRRKKKRRKGKVAKYAWIILGIIPRFPPYYIADLANVSRFLGRKKRILGSSFERKRKTRVAQQILRLRGSSLSLPFIYIYIAFDEQSERIIHAPLLKPLIKTR